MPRRPANARDVKDGARPPRPGAGGRLLDLIDYWVRDPVLGAMSVASHQALRLLSVDACSEAGARHGMPLHRITGRYRMPADDQAARANWVALRPDQAAPAQVDAAVARLWDSICRMLAEYSVLERLWPQGRIRIVGAEHVTAAWASGRPLLVTNLHLGAWEAMSPALLGLGIPVTGVYQPPANRFEDQVAVAARLRAGLELIAPGDTGGARALHRVLTERRTALLMLVDEYVDGRVHAPAFGRPLTPKGNIANVARLAAMTGATVIPGYIVRQGASARQVVTFLPPVVFADTGAAKADLLTNVGILDAIIEPIVREHLDQWLMLPDFRFDR
jgi:lauroyl/myristoyl acyltransferase